MHDVKDLIISGILIINKNNKKYKKPTKLPVNGRVAMKQTSHEWSTLDYSGTLSRLQVSNPCMKALLIVIAYPLCDSHPTLSNAN